MKNYISCKILGDGSIAFEDMPCSYFINSADAYILNDSTFVAEYSKKYGNYIGLLFGEENYESNIDFSKTDKGILAFINE